MNKRRKLLLALSGASATTVWTKPVVDAVILPVHAETTEPTDPPTPTPTPTPTPAPEPDEVVQWQLMDVVFSDGGTASGSFTYNFTSDTVTDWDITVSGGNTGNFPPRSYTMENSMSDVSVSNINNSLTNVGFLNPGTTNGIRIVARLTSAGGTVSISAGPGASSEANALGVFRQINPGGSLVGTFV